MELIRILNLVLRHLPLRLLKVLNIGFIDMCVDLFKVVFSGWAITPLTITLSFNINGRNLSFSYFLKFLLCFVFILFLNLLGWIEQGHQFAIRMFHV